MDESVAAKQDLERLSAKAHTPASFGRAIVAASLSAAARDAGRGPVFNLKLDVTVTQIQGVGAYVCVGLPGLGRFCQFERNDGP